MLFFKIYIRTVLKKWPFYAVAWGSMLIGLMFATSMLVRFKIQYFHDRHHEHYNRIYQLHNKLDLGGGHYNIWTTTSIEEVAATKMYIPEVEAVTRYTRSNAEIVLRNGIHSVTDWGLYADTSFYQVFTLPLICGDLKTALKEPLSIILTQTTAHKLFGDSIPLGKTLKARFNNRTRMLKVTAVVQDCPLGASIQYAFITPIEIYHQVNPGDFSGWGNCSFSSALLLNKHATQEALDARLRSIASKRGHRDPKLMAIPYTKATSIYYDSNGQEHNYRIFNYVFSLVLAILFLVVASFNYSVIMNSMLFDRIKEVSIHKINGATRRKMAARLLLETTAVLFLILCFAIALTVSVSKVANGIIIKSFGWEVLGHPFMLISFAIVLVVGLFITSFFPSLFIASVPIQNLLKNMLQPRKRRNPLRLSMLFFQLFVGNLLVFLTLGSQHISSLALSDEWGINRKNVWVLTTATMNNKDIRAIKDELMRTPGIEAVSCLMNNGTTTSVEWTGKDPENILSFQITNVDAQFDSVMNLNLMEGRFFGNVYRNDSNNMVINETAAKLMGVKNPIGLQIKCWGLDGKVIGVVKDFRYGPMDRDINPIIMLNDRSKPYQILIKSSLPENLIYAKVKSLYMRFEQDYPVQFQSYSNRYILSNGEVSNSKIEFLVYAMAVLFITCIGILAFTALSVHRRTKEIGIRKANGASALQILLLLNRPLLIAYTVGLSFSILVASQFLKSYFEVFAFSPSVPAWIFVEGSVFVLLLVVTTSFVQSWRMAARNPSESLRYE